MENQVVRITTVKVLIACIVWYMPPAIIAIVDYHYGLSTLNCGWIAFIGVMLVYAFYAFTTITGGISIVRKYKAARSLAREINARFANIGE